MNIGVTPWVIRNLIDVRVRINYRSSLGKDDTISTEKDQESVTRNKGEIELVKTNIENHIL